MASLFSQQVYVETHKTSNSSSTYSYLSLKNHILVLERVGHKLL